MSTTKRQQTQEKRLREQAVKQRRLDKLARKAAQRAAKAEAASIPDAPAAGDAGFAPTP